MFNSFVYVRFIFLDKQKSRKQICFRLKKQENTLGLNNLHAGLFNGLKAYSLRAGIRHKMRDIPEISAVKILCNPDLAAVCNHDPRPLALLKHQLICVSGRITLVKPPVALMPLTPRMHFVAATRPMVSNANWPIRLCFFP